jgi:photoactive yellow protein
MAAIVEDYPILPVEAESRMRFEQPDLLTVLCAASHEEYDAADFGIVAMDLDSVVSYYNAWESQLSGLQPGNVIGRHFFTEIAPCTNNFMVALKYEAEELDELVDYVFSYRLRPVAVRLRLLKCTALSRQFLVVERATKA